MSIEAPETSQPHQPAPPSDVTGGSHRLLPSTRKRARRKRRFLIPVAMFAVGVLGLLLLPPPPQPLASSQSNFMGGAPSQMDLAGMNTMRLRFPAGVRSNWHSHAEGQLLMVEEGRGVTQDRGGALRVAMPGQPWWTPAGVEHWHGAHPDEDVVQMTIYAGGVDWLEPVTDDVYRAPAGR